MKEPLQVRVAGWLEALFNPIMVKELRASLRGARFFAAHVTILVLFAAGLLITFGAGISEFSDSDPSKLGRLIFFVTQLIHLGVVFLVVPGLAATSVTAEREALTHDLLLTTTLSAREIVWGKFTAAMTQTFTIFVSMVPLVGLCFLFGGVTLYQILANYAFLFGLAALVIAFALSISAGARTTQRAVGTVYAAALGAGILVATAIAAGVDGEEGFADALAAYGFLPAGDVSRRSPTSLFRRIVYVHVLPGFAWGSLLSLFFLNATNRLKPHFSDRSTALRVYTLAVMAGAAALFLTILYVEIPLEESPASRSEAAMGFALALQMASLLTALFACEDPVLPAHLAAAAAKRPLLRLIGPGSAAGSGFCLAANGLLQAACFAALAPYAAGFDQGPWAGLPAAYPLAVSMATCFLWTWFTATFARWLAAVFPDRPVLLRTVFILACLSLACLPALHWGIASQIDPGDLETYGRRHGPLTAALSPALAVLSALELNTLDRNFPLLAAGVPIPALFALFAGTGGGFFLWRAWKAEARLRQAQLRIRDLRRQVPDPGFPIPDAKR